MPLLDGKKALHLPAYTGALPAVVTVRCFCGLRYAVFTGAVVVGQGCELAKSSAEARGFVFVDARSEPFKLCGCGQALDFSAGAACELVM